MAPESQAAKDRPVRPSVRFLRLATDDCSEFLVVESLQGLGTNVAEGRQVGENAQDGLLVGAAQDDDAIETADGPVLALDFNPGFGGSVGKVMSPSG